MGHLVRLGHMRPSVGGVVSTPRRGTVAEMTLVSPAVARGVGAEQVPDCAGAVGGS